MGLAVIDLAGPVQLDALVVELLEQALCLGFPLLDIGKNVAKHERSRGRSRVRDRAAVWLARRHFARRQVTSRDEPAREVLVLHLVG